MSVDAVAAQMASATIGEPNSSAARPKAAAGASDPASAAQNEAVIASASEGRRLYIGNLAYATTEGELKEFFKDYLVETTSIPLNPRTQRPVGYAFVDVSAPSEAERAIANLNGKVILDRKISVQLARKPEPISAAQGEEEGQEATPRRQANRSRGRARGPRNGQLTRKGENADGDAGAELPLTDTTNDLAAPADDGTTVTAAATDATKGAQNKRQRAAAAARKQRGPPEDGIASKTKIMVANLPYEMREDKLMELFASYQPVSAKIALRPIPKYMIKKLEARGEPRKGRGFGFVTLASEELQTKACAEMNSREVDGREIAVKVAIDSPGKEDEDPNVQAAVNGAGSNGPSKAIDGSAAANTAAAA